MTSNFVQPIACDCPSGLSDAITSQYAIVRIVERYPATGPPPAGTPFTIKVEVQTFKTGGPSVFRTPFACLDAFVAVRGLYKYADKILGGAFVRTDTLSNCRGTARITFDPEFSPGSADWVQLELYEGGTTEWFSRETTIEDVKQGRKKPIAISEPMTFHIGREQGREIGLYQQETSPAIFGVVGDQFGQITQAAKFILPVAIIGAGAFYLAPFAPSIHRAIKSRIKKTRRA